MSERTRYVDDGGQAFSRLQWEYDGQNNVLQYQEEGTTLRDYFATEAMKALLREHGTGNLTVDKMQYAYDIADLMIKARKL